MCFILLVNPLQVTPLKDLLSVTSQGFKTGGGLIASACPSCHWRLCEQIGGKLINYYNAKQCNKVVLTYTISFSFCIVLSFFLWGPLPLLW